MFQFQCWLLDTWEQERSFRRSAVIFGAAALSREISRRSKKGLTTEHFFLLVVVSKNMEEIINHCFATRNNIYALLSAGAFPLSKKGHDDALAIIKKLNTVLEVRLRLHAASQPSSLAKTWEMLPKLAKGIGAETILKPLHKARRQRQPFLYAAQRVAPEFLKMNFDGSSTFITPEGLLSQMVEKARNRDLFRRLCGAAKAIARVVDVAWSAEVVSALDRVEAELPAMEAIPVELLPKKVPRRHAEETEKQARKRVGN